MVCLVMFPDYVVQGHTSQNHLHDIMWLLGLCGQHLKQLASVPNMFSNNRLALDSLQLKMYCWSLRFLTEKGFISQVFKAKASSATKKYDMSLSSLGIWKTYGPNHNIVPQLALIKDLGIRTVPITPHICPQTPVVSIHQN